MRQESDRLAPMNIARTIAIGAGIGLALWAVRRFGAPGAMVAKLDPLKSNPQNAERHRWARPIVSAAIKSIIGRAPSIVETQYGQAIGWLESSYGRGWGKCPCKNTECDMAGAAASNNWGAVQAKGGVPSFQWCDTNPDGSEYAQHFRSYDSPEAGAADMLSHIFKSRKAVADALKSEGATVYRASLAMRRTTYFGGWCPNAIKGGAVSSYGDPKGDPKKLACEAEAVAMHAKRAKTIIDDVAASNSDPGAMPLGTLEDAIRWYDSRKGTV